jgi:4'-phosphopantetheinyl transferase
MREPTPASAGGPRRLAPGEVHVFTADLDGTDSDDSVLSEDELERAARFRFDVDRHRFVAGRATLRRLLAAYLDTAPAAVELRYGAQGRPFVPGPGLSFNVAHSGSTALFAFAPGFDVGVDVELLAHARPGDERVADRFFSPLEVATLRAHASAARPHAFLRCWTRKEAFVKARGDGLSLPLQAFDVTFAEGVRPAVLRTSWSADEPTEWTLVDISAICPGAVAALAARTETCAVHTECVA